MANYQLLKADIDAKVYQNGKQEITGENLNSVLNQMVNILGTGYQFTGVATIDTNPGTPDAKVFYIANGKGTYTNFGSIEVTEDEVVVLYYDTAWHKEATGIASQEKLSELEENVSILSEKVGELKEGTTSEELTYPWQKGVWGGDGNYNSSNSTFISTTVQSVPIGASLKCTFTESPRLLRIVGFDENNVFQEIYTGGYISSDAEIKIKYPKIAFSEAIDGSTPVTPSWDSGIVLTLVDDLQLVKDIKKEIPFIKGKNIVSFGDSIMAGDGNSGIGIVDILKERYGVTGQDYAVGGSAMQYFDGHGHIPTQIQTQINNHMSAPDVFLIDGLSNDISYSGSVLGTLTDSFDYETQGYTTFVGGMEYAIGLLKENYPQVPIIYMLPHSTPSRPYQAEITYGDMAKTICKKWSVPVIDIYSDGNLNARITYQKSLYCDSGGTHPNQQGYDKYYIPLTLALIKTVL